MAKSRPTLGQKQLATNGSKAWVTRYFRRFFPVKYGHVGTKWLKLEALTERKPPPRKLTQQNSQSFPHPAVVG